MENKEKEETNTEEKGEALSINSVDGIAWVAERWGEIEVLVSILSMKVKEIAEEDFLPASFIIDSGSKSVILVYSENKTRRIPLEALLVMDNEEMFSKLIEIYLEFIDPPKD